MRKLTDKVSQANTESNPQNVTCSVVAEVHTMRAGDNNLCMVLVLVFILNFDAEKLSDHHRSRALRRSRQSEML